MIDFIQYIKEQSETDVLTPVDIYDFYYLTYIFQKRKNFSQEESFVFNQRLMELKTKYLNNFGNLLKSQLKKYKSRGRHDPDFNVPDNSDFDSLHLNMGKTYRSDMSRRNTNWELITKNVVELNKSSSVKDILFYIDRINESVHNTETGVLEKIHPNLLQAFDHVHASKDPKDFIRYVSREVRTVLQMF